MYHIPVLDSLLQKSLTVKPIYYYNAKEIESIYKSVILLSMRFYNCKQFKSALSFLDKSDIQALSTNIHFDSNLLLKIRGFVYDLIQNPVSSNDEGKTRMVKFNLINKKSYATSIQNLDLLRLIKDTKFLEKHFTQIKSFPEPLTPKEATILCANTVKTLMPVIKSFTYKKLRFLANSNCCSLEDLHSTLVSAICANCYDIQANYRGKHLLNFLKRTIKSTGLNLIGYYTAQSRQRLVEDEEGFSSKVMSSSISTEDGSDSNIFDLIGEEDPGIETIEMRTSLFFQMKKLIDEYGENSKEARLLAILSNKSKDFVKWYNIQKGVHFTNVIDIQEEEGKRFMYTLQLYFGLGQSEFDALLKDIKPRVIDLLGE